MRDIILVAGGTGNIGGRLVNFLVEKGARVRVVVRQGSDPGKIETFEGLGVEVVTVDMFNVEELTKACAGVSCVVSTLAGLENVIVDLQKLLLDAAIAAGVPRFIPSDFSIDFTKLEDGENRNLDFRREFKQYLDSKDIQATTIFNGAFAELLTNEMPLVLSKINRVLFWGNAHQKMDFTTMDNVALFTAYAAMDSSTPRYLTIAGDQISPAQVKEVMTHITGTPYKLLRPGGLSAFKVLIKIAKTVAPGKDQLYPAWQGMQYMHNMLKGDVLLKNLDNQRYPNMQWTTVKEVLSQHYS